MVNKECKICGLNIRDSLKKNIKISYNYKNKYWVCDNCKFIKIKNK